MTTTTLFKVIQSELINSGLNEFVNEKGELIFFDKDQQFITKIMRYDDEIVSIIDDLFSGFSLDNAVHDQHFKKAFMYRFINRQINRQTIESFKMELISVFMTYENYINRSYQDIEKYLHQHDHTQAENTSKDNQSNQSNTTQTNLQNSNSTGNSNNTSDNRQAHSNLPQNNVQLDVDNTIMTSANTNDISRNKQTGNNSNEDQTNTETEGLTDSHSESESQSNANNDSQSYRLDELFKTTGMLDNILNKFDERCFLQIW